MSFLNSRRDVFHGVGGGNASINNLAFSKGGAAGFLNDDEAFYANGSEGWVCYIWNHTTKQARPAIQDPSDPQFGQGMNHGYAGGGVWAAWLSGRGLFSSTGFCLPAGGLMAVGLDGSIGFKRLYQSFGPTDAISVAGQHRFVAMVAAGTTSDEALNQLELEGLVWQISALSGGDLQLLEGQRAIWQYANQIQVLGLPQPLQVGKAWAPRAHLIGGRWWVSYFSDVAGIVAHPVDELRGFVVVPPGVDRWHSAREEGSDIVFALFVGIAEQDGQLLPLAVVDTRQPLVPLEPPVPELPPLVLPPAERPLWAGCFEFAQAPQGPGNAMLQVRNYQGALPRPAIIGLEEVGQATGAFLGVFLSGGSVEEIEAAAKAATLRPVAYWDNNVWPRWPALPPGAWLCIRCYWQKVQTLGAFVAEARKNISSAPLGVPLVLVVQQYSSNADQQGFVDPRTPAPQDSTELRKLAPIFVQLANESPAVLALMLFSGYGRRGGLMDHPDLLDAWTRWVAQLPAPPKLDAYPPVSPQPIPPPKYPSARPYEKRSA